MFGPLRAGEPAQVVGLGLGQERQRQDQRRRVGAEATAGDPTVADACILDERDAGLFVADRALSDVSAHQRLPQHRGQREAVGVMPVGLWVDQPHRQSGFAALNLDKLRQVPGA